jgi:hypothetical protein
LGDVEWDRGADRNGSPILHFGYQPKTKFQPKLQLIVVTHFFKDGVQKVQASNLSLGETRTSFNYTHDTLQHSSSSLSTKNATGGIDLLTNSFQDDVQ